MKASFFLIAVTMATALFGVGQARAWDHHGGFHGGFAFRHGPHRHFFAPRTFVHPRRFAQHRRIIVRRPVIIRPPVIIEPPVVVPPPAIIVPRVVIVPPPRAFPRQGFFFEEFGSNVDP